MIHFAGNYAYFETQPQSVQIWNTTTGIAININRDSASVEVLRRAIENNRNGIDAGTLIAGVGDRRMIDLWMQSHPDMVAESPALTNLRNRVTPGAQAQFTPTQLFIEEKILSGQSEELLRYFIEFPGELPKQIALIMAHFELNTLSMSKEWLSLLLEHASADDIIAIFKATGASLPNISSLSKCQMFRLCAILNNMPEVEDSTFRAYQTLIKKESNVKAAISFCLNEISGEEKYASLANYIERHQIALKEIKNEMSETEFLRLAPHIRYVDLNSFEPVELGQRFLKQCKNLNILKLDSGAMLNGIEELPLCQKLKCDSTTLTSLPALPLCKELSCICCSSLSALPSLPHCQKLQCNGCVVLTSLPPLPLCQNLDCFCCIALTSLSELPVCKEIIGHACLVLTALPPLPLCEKLQCNGCVVLTTLPPLPLCRELNCSMCGALSTLPPLPSCQQLDCNGCPLNELPEMPWNAQVITSDENRNALPFASLNVDIEKFTANSKALLVLLGTHLLQNKPFPNIYYFEKGVRNEAIDHGGVRRDFITKLCLNLFNAQGFARVDNLPAAASDSDERTYRAFGALMAQCYRTGSTYKTGPLLDPIAYRCLLTPNPGSDEWLLTNYLDLVNAPALTDKLSQEDLTKLAYLAEPDASDISKYTQEYFNEPTNRNALMTDLLASAKQDKRLKALAWIAQELRRREPDIEGNLQARIEGVLNQEALKAHLRWDFIDPRFVVIRDYLFHWIDNHPDQLEKFVYAISGNRTLCANPLTIQVFNRDKDFIPVAHTCFFSLELSGNCENQAQFDEKLAYFLENALAGSGFTMA